ncbi:hypothetical protein AB0F77_35160 [Streptomyces sp. NPDC026672]|uniref:hypothetical protein n=1 Tax=unclassified Streptomyces TaxID=2593676 RepID=UPI0033D8A55F
MPTVTPAENYNGDALSDFDLDVRFEVGATGLQAASTGTTSSMIPFCPTVILCSSTFC